MWFYDADMGDVSCWATNWQGGKSKIATMWMARLKHVLKGVKREKGALERDETSRYGNSGMRWNSLEIMNKGDGQIRVETPKKRNTFLEWHSLDGERRTALQRTK